MQSPRRGRFLRRVALATAFIALNLFVLELAARAWFAFQLGPRVLAYGTQWHRLTAGAGAVGGGKKKDPWDWSVQSHHNDAGSFRAYDPEALGYSKYFPGEKKWTESPDRKEKWPVRINNQGFRGADFEVEKPPGTIRILTLGASSTFGYHDRDDETYPFLLQRELEKLAKPGTRIEVINFAIPHAMTDNLLAMFLAEGVKLKPDLVTFYEGANDAVVIEPREGAAPRKTWRERLTKWSVLAALYDSLVPRSNADETDIAWWWSDELAARRSAHFVGNLKRLAEECRERGIDVVFATQQFQSTLLPEAERRGVTYDQELAMLRERIARGEMGPRKASISFFGRATSPADAALTLRAKGFDTTAILGVLGFEYSRAMLVHSRLMADLRAWAGDPASGVGFVDVVRALDDRRDWLVNWVHLCGEANAVIARSLARGIALRLGFESPAPAREAPPSAREGTVAPGQPPA